MSLVVSILGWIGSAAVICAYGLISINKLDGRSNAYQVLNLFGAIGLICNTFYHGAYPSAFVNTVWSIIAVLALVRLRISSVSKGKQGVRQQLASE